MDIEVCTSICSAAAIQTNQPHCEADVATTSRRCTSTSLTKASRRKLVDYTKSRGLGPSLPQMLQAGLRSQKHPESADSDVILTPVGLRQKPQLAVCTPKKNLCGNDAGSDCHQQEQEPPFPRRIQSLEVIPTYLRHKDKKDRQEHERVEFMFRIQPRQRNRGLSSRDRIKELADALANKPDSPKMSPLVVTRKIRRPALFKDDDSSGKRSLSPKPRSGMRRHASERLLRQTSSAPLLSRVAEPRSRHSKR